MTFKKDHRSITSHQGLVKTYLRSINGETVSKFIKTGDKNWIEIAMVFWDSADETVKKETVRPALGR